jgi:hypothetical protein
VKPTTSPFRLALLPLTVIGAMGALTGCDDDDSTQPRSEQPTEQSVALERIGAYASGLFDEGGAEIVAWEPDTATTFVVNSGEGTVDLLDLSDPTNPVKVSSLDVTENWANAGDANSIAVSGNTLAVAVENDDKQAPGRILFYDASSLAYLDYAEAGALPDMVTFSPDGNKVIAANEGEPSDDYQTDPEGSVTIVDISRGVTSAPVTQASFQPFNDRADELRAAGLRLAGANDPTVAQDVEPEYVAVSADSTTAWVTLQENDAIARVDLVAGRIEAILPLGTKDHSLAGNGLDANKNDEVARIVPEPFHGLYMPDAIAGYSVGGADYLVTANEGDGREYIDEDNYADETACLTAGGIEFDDGECLFYTDEADLEDVTLDPDTFSAEQIATLQDGKGLGDLTVSRVDGDIDGDGDIDRIHTFGARSFSIWNADGDLVWDSGDRIAQKTAEAFPDHFNASNDDQSIDDRSDNKGAEPEGVTIGEIDGRYYAFVGLERIGGIMTFEVTDPSAPVFQNYINPRDFTVDIDQIDAGNLPADAAGDLGPEGLLFIPADQSPDGTPLLVVGNEVSGTTAVYRIDVTP